MSLALLTIAIPTYNRSSFLEFLLSVLSRELKDLAGQVRVFVSDNGSTDNTPAVVKKYQTAINGLTHQRHEQNTGADRNISDCFTKPDTPYVWIMGDDDAPLPGAIAQVLEFIEQHRPDMIYLPSTGRRDITENYPLQKVSARRWIPLSREKFARVLNVQLTFISGLVFRKDAATAGSIAAGLCHTMATNLIQLAWTLEILKQGERFYIADKTMLVATAGNSGGYSVLQVFLVNHTLLVNLFLRDYPSVAKSILARTSACYAPGLLWNLRINRMGKFDMPSPSAVKVPPELSRLLSYRFLVRPIWSWPIALAWPFFQLSRVVARSARLLDRWVALR